MANVCLSGLTIDNCRCRASEDTEVSRWHRLGAVHVVTGTRRHQRQIQREETMKIRGLRWWIISLICLGTIINYLARNSLGVMAPILTTELNFSTQEYSYVVAAFQLAYTIMQPVCGYIVDFLGLKAGFALFALL